MSPSTSIGTELRHCFGVNGSYDLEANGKRWLHMETVFNSKIQKSTKIQQWGVSAWFSLNWSRDLEGAEKTTIVFYSNASVKSVNYTLAIRINRVNQFSVHEDGRLMVVWQINANNESFPEEVCCCSRQMITYSAAVWWRSTKHQSCRFMGSKIIKKLKQQLFLGGAGLFI